MAAVLGKVNMFDPEHDELSQYVERLDQFNEANDLMGDAKATKWPATFLTVIGPGPNKFLCSLISRAKPTDKTYDEVVKKLTEHYSPTPLEVMQRFQFNSRSRKTEESVAAYMADLHRLHWTKRAFPTVWRRRKCVVDRTSFTFPVEEICMIYHVFYSCIKLYTKFVQYSSAIILLLTLSPAKIACITTYMKCRH